MYNKIRDYVFFKLRHDHAEDHLEKKEEIIANISDRYDALYEQTKDQDYAYVEAIKTVGDFSSEINEEEAYKPQLAEMLLVSATVLSVIALLATLLSGLAGVILVGVSMTLYAVGATYLYQYSQFIQTEQYDISKYHRFIDKTFSYMKTNFTFWAISLSLILARLIYHFMLGITAISTMNNLMVEDLFSIFFLTAIGFFIVLAIVGFIFYRLYIRLMEKYKDLTGKDDVQSVALKARTFIGKKTKKVEENHNIFTSKWFYPSIYGIVVIVLLLDILSVMSAYSGSVRPLPSMVIIVNVMLILFNIVISIFFIVRMIKKHLLLPMIQIVVAFFVTLIWVFSDFRMSGSINGQLYFFVGLIFLVLLIIDYIKNVNSR